MLTFISTYNILYLTKEIFVNMTKNGDAIYEEKVKYNSFNIIKFKLYIL